MRRWLFRGAFAAALIVPAASYATMGRSGDNDRAAASVSIGQFNRSTLGGGMYWGTDPGHVSGPGKTPVDTDTRGIINDVQPGRGTDDTLQSRKPKPAPNQ
jgi:hypothetical protein